jgi:hypothetical protein
MGVADAVRHELAHEQLGDVHRCRGDPNGPVRERRASPAWSRRGAGSRTRAVR